MEEFFVPEVVCGADDALWDPLMMSVFSPDDEGLKNFENDDNYNFFPIQLQEDFANKMMSDQAKLKGSRLSGYYGNQYSISTFHSAYSVNSTSNELFNVVNNNSSDDDISTDLEDSNEMSSVASLSSASSMSSEVSSVALFSSASSMECDGSSDKNLDRDSDNDE